MRVPPSSNGPVLAVGDRLAPALLIRRLVVVGSTGLAAALSSMLSYAGRLPYRHRVFQPRRALPQLDLNFADLPIPETRRWEQWDDEQQQMVVETLARLITKAARATNQEETHD